MKDEAGDWQLKQVSRLEILQTSESLPQYLAPHCGHPTTLPAIGLRHCQQIAAGLLAATIGLTAGTGCGLDIDCGMICGVGAGMLV
jgi:hypothetical protein